MKAMKRFVVAAALAMAACAGSAGSAGAAAQAPASHLYTFRLADLGSSLDMPGSAYQLTRWTYHYEAPKMACAIGGTGTGQQRLDFNAPWRLTLLRMRIGGPPAWIKIPATLTRSGHYTPDLGALPAGCAPEFGYGSSSYPVEHGGCGTVFGILHLGFRLLANPRGKGHEQLELLGRFTSGLGATMFSVCIPSPPAPVADGRFLPTTWSLTVPLSSATNHLTFTAESSRFHHYHGNPDGFTGTFIRVGLNLLDPSAPCVRHSCGY